METKEEVFTQNHIREIVENMLYQHKFYTMNNELLDDYFSLLRTILLKPYVE